MFCHQELTEPGLRARMDVVVADRLLEDGLSKLMQHRCTVRQPAVAIAGLKYYCQCMDP